MCNWNWDNTSIYQYSEPKNQLVKYCKKNSKVELLRKINKVFLRNEYICRIEIKIIHH